MKFEALPLAGAWLISPEKSSDDRGFFARIFCVEEFAAHGIESRFVQASISFNRARGTVRGMHFQWSPSRESKLVRCTRGAIHDILLDLRPDSPTFLQHSAVQLDEADASALYIPPGFGHGFQTLSDDAMLQYHMTDVFQPALADGYCWNDPSFSIALPLPVSIIAPRDAGYRPFDRAAHEAKYRSQAQSRDA